jgi:hypothetical protein
MPPVLYPITLLKDARKGVECLLQFRTDFFNLFNDVNFSNPNLTLTKAASSCQGLHSSDRYAIVYHQYSRQIFKRDITADHLAL